jgi:hypothetical protein
MPNHSIKQDAKQRGWFFNIMPAKTFIGLSGSVYRMFGAPYAYR